MDLASILGAIFVIVWRFWHEFSILLRHRILHAFLDTFFRVLVQNGRQMAPKDVAPDPSFGAQWPPKNSPKTQPRFFMDLASILGAILVIFWRFWHDI